VSSHDGQKALCLDHVTVRYGKATAAEAVSFSVPRGSVYALLGRNGAGKSSLIRCLLGQRKPQEGEVTIFGEDPWSNRARLMARLGVVPEEPDAPPT
jgi:ABC-2 type transport system ATP-binding protein